MMKSDTVYILGAGFNRNGETIGGLRAPLSEDFFQLLFKSKALKFTGDIEQYRDVFDYIEGYWKLNVEDLKNEKFNLEECFTLLDLQMMRYEKLKDYDHPELKKLATISFRLTGLLAEFLQEIDSLAYSKNILAFGKKVYKERSNVITFNYDCIVENAIQSASGVRQTIPKAFLKSHRRDYITDEELSYSHCNWNQPLAYGIEFDEVQLQRSGVSAHVTGKRFYSHPQNKLYNWNVIKLHGSLNWFRYLPIRLYPALNKKRQGITKKTLNKTLLRNDRWWGGRPPSARGWIIIPKIITPIIHKNFDEPPFDLLWKRAKECLMGCKKLVIIGYSFSSSDFATKQLLLESFKDNSLVDLCIITPKGRSKNKHIVALAKKLTHFKGKEKVYNSLEEFLAV